MPEKRTANRLQKREFQSYRVQMMLENRVYTGTLGDISEKGLSMLLAATAPLYIEGWPQILLTISGPHLQTPIRLQANIQRQAEVEFQYKSYLLLGLRFEKNLILPDQMIAAQLAGA